MRRILSILILFILVFTSSSGVKGQNDTTDSARIHELSLQLEEMRQNEVLLRAELARTANLKHTADSIKLAEQIRGIDSLRAVTPGVPVVVEDDTLFRIFASRGGYSAADRAEMVRETMTKIGKNPALRMDSIYLLDNEHFVDIMYGNKVILSVTEEDGYWHHCTPMKLASVYMPIIENRIKIMRAENSLWTLLKRSLIFVAVIFAQYLLIKLINYLFKKLRLAIIRFKEQKLKPLVLRDYELLNTESLTHILLVISNFLRYVVLLLLLVLTVPILFSIFPQTEGLALKIFYYIIDPIKMVASSIVEYIPNLFIIGIIWYCVRYIIKGLHYISNEIRNEKLKITGFYPDWAEPTFNIIRFLLYAFMIAMIYPYLPVLNPVFFRAFRCLSV